MTRYAERTLALDGLDLAPPQVWGNVRLVPLIRRQICGDLRLGLRTYHESLSVVSMDGELLGDGTKYVSFVPHAFVVSWTPDGSPVACFGGALGNQERGKDGISFGKFVHLNHRMAKREGDHQLRILPLHLAMEGFLALHCGGPGVAWTEYSRRALSRGLDPRTEWSAGGCSISGLRNALRVFEIHEHQTGVLVFVAEALASAFVVPHPQDYRLLHQTLLEDFFGELMVRYGWLYPEAAPAMALIDDGSVHTLQDLRAGIGRMRDDWAAFARLLTSGLMGRPVRTQVAGQMRPFQLLRFTTGMQLHEENHIGEMIVRDDGTLEYLKTYRLSDAQARRAHLLEQLSACEWDLDRTAVRLGSRKEELIRRLDNAGFGYLIKPHVLEAAKRGR